MNGQESLWGWLGLGVMTSVVGGTVAALTADWLPAQIAGLVLAGLGGLLVSICTVGIGVSVGMLRYDHLRRR